MTERPILFSGPMVRAILDGRKTQTRRVVKAEMFNDDRGDYWVDERNDERCYLPENPPACPYGAPGDLLWVRETWQHFNNEGQRAEDFPEHYRHSHDCFYLADESDPASKPFSGKWRPSIHMPRWASRITLRITDVRVERLQEISEADAKAEGCDCRSDLAYDGTCFDTAVARGYRADFQRLWDTINGKRAPWDSNPWVWVIAFERSGEF